ncbi:Ankyrin repeat-containing protein [Heracleum sosnowskyi]|uniref:Ankyrin repeat-containing protein n=1 Tax=Heracleum sosnowskyi TaxID=360622 RepID=A0AAD8M9Z8_9APIA|nr:Ankyrin repeat-containing protein [Heracleum sosnowskyi]
MVGVLPQPDSDVPPHLRHLAAAGEQGDADALRQDLDTLAGIIDEPLEDGDTALHLAFLYGHLPCVQILLERGASLESKGEDGAIPSRDACAGRYTDIVQLLLNNANDTNIVKRMLESVDVEGDTVCCFTDFLTLAYNSLVIVLTVAALYERNFEQKYHQQFQHFMLRKFYKMKVL